MIIARCKYYQGIRCFPRNLCIILVPLIISTGICGGKYHRVARAKPGRTAQRDLIGAAQEKITKLTCNQIVKVQNTIDTVQIIITISGLQIRIRIEDVELTIIVE